MLRMEKRNGYISVAVVLALLTLATVAQSQVPNQTTQSSFAGKYEGTLKDATGEAKLTLEIVEESGKFSGDLTTPRGSFKILKGQLAEGLLTLEIERPGGAGTMTLSKSDTGLTASFSEAGKNHKVELQKIVADEISGDWDAVADASGQPFPFALTLKLDGEKVTGSSVSQLGNSNVSEGSWKKGQLAVILESANGKIALMATMIDGKLSGEYDFAGQLQGKWVAIKKK